MTNPRSLFPSKRTSCQVWEQPTFIVHHSISLCLSLRKDPSVLTNNLVRIVHVDDGVISLWGGDQLLHAVEVEEKGAPVVEGESPNFADLGPISQLIRVVLGAGRHEAGNGHSVALVFQLTCSNRSYM